MFVYLMVIALGIGLIVYSQKRRKEYRSYGTWLTLGIFLVLLPLLVFLTVFFAVVSGAAAA